MFDSLNRQGKLAVVVLRDVTYWLATYLWTHSCSTCCIDTNCNVSVIARHMRWGRQEDAHEFLRYMVEAMHKSCVNGHQMWAFLLLRISTDISVINICLGAIEKFASIVHSCLLVVCLYSNTYTVSQFSQGSAATYFMCIGRSYTIFICTSSENVTVKELLTLRELWGIIMLARFFETQCMMCNLLKKIGTVLGSDRRSVNRCQNW